MPSPSKLVPPDGSAEPPHKLRRLEQLRRSTPYVSQSALAAIIEDIKKNGIPKEASRSQFTKATKFVLGGDYAYGPLKTNLKLLQHDGKTIQVPALNWKSYMAALFAESNTFHHLLTTTHDLHKPEFDRPLGLILYMDEITPGNVLSNRLTRKCWCVYASILEFPLQALGQELAWAPLLHIRSKLVDTLQGGISQVFGCLLQSIFLDNICDPRLGLLLPKEHCPSLKLYVDL